MKIDLRKVMSLYLVLFLLSAFKKSYMVAQKSYKSSKEKFNQTNLRLNIHISKTSNKYSKITYFKGCKCMLVAIEKDSFNL